MTVSKEPARIIFANLIEISRLWTVLDKTARADLFPGRNIARKMQVPGRGLLGLIGTISHSRYQPTFSSVQLTV
jgi:hypothetical protein